MSPSDKQVKQLLQAFPLSILGPVGIPLTIMYVFSVLYQQREKRNWKEETT